MHLRPQKAGASRGGRRYRAVSDNQKWLVNNGK